MVLDFNIVYSLLSKFERDGQEETPSTPVHLVREMLDKLPLEIWSNPDAKFLDPACSTGTFLLEIVRKLNTGLVLEFPDQTDRLKHILTKQIWGSEMSRVPLLVTKAAFEKLFIDTTGIVGEVNIYPANALDGVKEIKNMKFDVVVGNPPYQAPQDAEGKRGSGDTLWNKFVQKSVQHFLKDKGYLCFVHPAGWRKPQSPRSQFLGMFQMLAHDNHLMFLSIHNTKDGMKTFGAGTRYDWYVMQKGSRGVTKVMTEKKESIEVQLRDLNWLPNSMIEEIVGLMGDDGEVLFTCKYHTQNGAKKGLMSTSSNSKFCYPLVHSTTKKGVRYYWTCRNDLEHFTTPKAIFGESGINDVIIDVKGEYGMTQGAMAIPIENQEDGEKLKEFLTSDSFKETLSACSWSNFRIDWRMFRDFKKGFWRQQENE